MRRLDCIGHALAQGLNSFLQCLQAELWEEYNLVLKREEILWFQNSRCKWLLFRDKISKYFHGLRRRQNQFDMLQKEDGTSVTDVEELEGLVIGFYQTLFTASDYFESFFINCLNSSVSDEEVFRTVW